jgi:hypothetical protein
MNKKLVGFVFLVVAGLYIQTSPVSADGDNFSLNPKLYLGVGAGFMTHDTGISGTTGTANLDEEDTAFKGYAGVKLNKIIGLEAFYANLGEVSLSGNNGDTFVSEGTTFQFIRTGEITIEAESYGLGAVVFIPTGIQFYPFFKVGVHAWEAEATETSSAGNASLTEDGTDVFFGAGFEWKLADKIGLRAEFERFDFDGEKVDFFSGGLTIFF